MNRAQHRRAVIGAATAAIISATVPLASPANAAAYDLVVTSVRPVVEGVQATGSNVTFEATIRNQGTAATPSGVIHGVAFKVDGSLVSWSDTYAASIAPGASVVVRANSGPTGVNAWTATTGSHTLLAHVDDVNRVPSELNEANNTRTASLVVTPVKPVGGVTAAPAVAASQFDAAHPMTVQIRWTAPVGQPVGTTYEVWEHPTDSSCGTWGSTTPRKRAVTTGTSATFDMEGGSSCFGHMDGYRGMHDAYSVIAVPAGATGPSAESTRTAECSWETRRSFTQGWLFSCGGVALEDTNAQGFKIDAGASEDTAWAYEEDKGFVGGAVHTQVISGLDRALHTSRWGFTKYTMPMPTTTPSSIVRMRFVEPTFTASGRRIFDVRVNGVLVASRLDIFARTGGVGRQLVLELEVPNTTGQVEIVPTSHVDNPIISAIEIEAKYS